MFANFENRFLDDIASFYCFLLTVSFWITTIVIDLLLTEFGAPYFAISALLICLTISLLALAVYRPEHPRLSIVLLIGAYYLYPVITVSTSMAGSSTWLFLLPGMLVAAVVLSREAVVVAWIAAMVAMLYPMQRTIFSDFETFLDVLKMVGPYIIFYSLASMLLYVKVADDENLIGWALRTQEKAAKRANAFFDQREQLQQALVREENTRWHLEVLNAELAEAKKAAEAINHLRARLLANVNHELRTPLNIILTYSHIALSADDLYNITLPKELNQDLRQLNDAAQYLSALVNDLLDLAQLEIAETTLHLETLDIGSILREILDVSIQTKDIAAGVECVLNLPDHLPALKVDPLRFRQMVYNLVNNAIKFTKQGTIEIGATVNASTIDIYVSDTGTGIPIEVQEDIFTPFFQTDTTANNGSNGIGLGLHIVHKLAGLHGGTVDVISQVGQGSTFTIRLPRAYAPTKNELVNLPRPPVLLLIAHHSTIRDTSQQIALRHEMSLYHLQDIRELDRLLRQALPMGIVWDFLDSSEQELQLIQALRKHASLSGLPIYVTHNESVAYQSLEMLTENATVTTKQIVIKRSRSILIVEDDAKARTATRRLLLNAFPRYLIQAVSNGDEALDYVKQQIPTLIILDLIMPRTDGFTFLQRMHQDLDIQSIPVLILTGKTLRHDDIERIAGLGDVVLHTKGVLMPDDFVKQVQRLLEKEQPYAEPTRHFVKQAIGFIHSNYQKNISREDLADSIGITQRYLSQIFKQEMGMTPWTYLNRMRLNQAKQLLQLTDKSIAVIAHSVGFQDVKYFSRRFREQEGMSPSTYRRQHLDSPNR